MELNHARGVVLFLGRTIQPSQCNLPILGFLNHQSTQSFLTGSIQPNTMKTKKKTTKKVTETKCDITVVLDRSGSMSSLASSTIEGFNAFLAEQQKQEGEACITVLQFDHEFLMTLDAVPVKEAKSLTPTTYVPRGTTALLDAIGLSIQRAESRVKQGDKVIFVITTDGEENASKEFTRPQIFDMITRLTGKGWQFVFMGANQDAFKTGGSIGIQKVNTISVTGNAGGTRAMYQSLSMNTNSVRAGGSSMAFSAADYAAQDDAK